MLGLSTAPHLEKMLGINQQTVSANCVNAIATNHTTDGLYSEVLWYDIYVANADVYCTVFCKWSMLLFAKPDKNRKEKRWERQDAIFFSFTEFKE